MENSEFEKKHAVDNTLLATGIYFPFLLQCVNRQPEIFHDLGFYNNVSRQIFVGLQ